MPPPHPHSRHTQPHSQDFVCGWGAACIETCATFPVNKVTFRQQLYGFPLREALQQLAREGPRSLYRGLLPPLIQKTSTRALMFGMYEEYQRLLGCQDNSEIFTSCHALAAFLAGSTEAVLTPLERVQVLLQTPDYAGRFRHTAHAFRELRASHGFREYYRGLTPILWRNGPSNILFFGLRDPIKKLVAENGRDRDHGAVLQLFGHFVSGAILGASLSTAFYPINVVKTRMQSQLGGDFHSFRRTFLRIWRERDGKLTGLFRGSHLNFSRSLFTWGITNATYELLERLLFGRDD